MAYNEPAMSTQPMTARGRSEPRAVQFSVFLANRVGQLKELLEAFSQRDVDVLGLSVVDSTDWAVIRVVLANPEKAREVFQSNSFPFTESDVLLVELAGEIALSTICSLLVATEISIHFAYPLILRLGGSPVMVLHVDNIVLARHTLAKHGARLLSDEDLSDLS